MGKTIDAPSRRARIATPEDVAAIAVIYNEGIEDRIGTFKTRLRSADDIRAWSDGKHPIVVVEEQEQIVAFASTSSYRPRVCYDGVAECSVYVSCGRRGRGVGRAAIEALIEVCEQARFWKLLSRIFAENLASQTLCRAAGFREVGVY